MIELFQFVMAISPTNDGTHSICDMAIAPRNDELFQFVMAKAPANDGTLSICDGHSPR